MTPFMHAEPDKRRCADCDWCGVRGDLLQAPNPFAAGETLLACPQCGAVDGTPLAVVCDEPGCRMDATCGARTPDGYRMLCGPHYRIL